MWTYRAKVIRVIDGDTVDVDVDLGFGIWQKNERVRIMGIDTPESRTRNKIEKKFGLAAKAKLKSRSPAKPPLILQPQQPTLAIADDYKDDTNVPVVKQKPPEKNQNKREIEKSSTI